MSTVNHPKHYNESPSGVECIDVVEHLPFNVGNAMKYLWRAGHKTQDATEDLAKANWYIEREIARLAKRAVPAPAPIKASPSVPRGARGSKYDEIRRLVALGYPQTSICRMLLCTRKTILRATGRHVSRYSSKRQTRIHTDGSTDDFFKRMAQPQADAPTIDV